MKQNITIEQLNDLSDKNKEKLREWWKPSFGDCCYHEEHEYWINDVADYAYHQSSESITPYIASRDQACPLLSIGQMIEVLDEHGVDFFTHIYKTAANGYTLEEPDEFGTWDKPPLQTLELCDALWEAVKEVLEAN